MFDVRNFKRKSTSVLFQRLRCGIFSLDNPCLPVIKLCQSQLGLCFSILPIPEREVGSAPDRRRFGWIVQKYMMAPLLVGGRKFDIRCWVLLLARPESERRDELEAYFFRDG